MEWITDPTAWIGLGTLILLELVLGIDNLIFIAILADKLPPEQRDRARIIGLSLALVMRLGLLFAISWMATLTQPLFSIYGFPVSGRQLILFAGGLFLLFKATMELHERLEGAGGGHGGSRPHAVFWQVIVQIVVLDAVFSLDSVITAVGMVDDIAVMMIAVVVAVAVMMISSRPLMNFVTAHPTVVILCLGFLMMIGFSLVIEGFGVHLPKGYLYAAIGFSILIEAFNQVARGNQKRLAASGNLRERTADAILRMLGGRQPEGFGGVQDAAAIAAADNSKVFAPAERKMIRGVLDLADRPVSSVMTPRREVVWLDPSAPRDALLERIKTTGHSRYPVAENDLQNVVGVVEAHEAVRDLIETGRLDLARASSSPLVVPESASVLKLLEMFRNRKSHFAVVVDEYGTLHGVVTPTDVLEAIAGDLPESGDERSGVSREGDGSWLFDGDFDVRQAGQLLGARLAEGGDYATLAGYVIHELGHLPKLGEQLVRHGLRFEVAQAGDRRIGKVRVHKDKTQDTAAETAAAGKVEVGSS